MQPAEREPRHGKAESLHRAHQLDLLAEHLVSEEVRRYCEGFLARHGHSVDLAGDLVSVAYLSLKEWMDRGGPFSDVKFDVPRLVRFAIVQRAYPRMLRAYRALPLRPPSQEGEDNEGPDAGMLNIPGPADDIPTPDFALLSRLILDRLRTGRIRGPRPEEVAAGAVFFAARRLGRIPRPAWMSEPPAGGTSDIEKLAWEVLEWVRGRPVPDFGSRTRQQKARLWKRVRAELREVWG